jgi:hypothetical protein
MNQLDPGTERASYFFIGGGNAHPMAAMYNAHVTGRWLNPGWGADAPGLSFTRDTEWAVSSGIVNVITMIGTDDELDGMTAALADVRPNFTVLLEATAPDRFGTSFKVVQIDPD